jgi:uncharacterized protein (DUF1800 family)
MMPMMDTDAAHTLIRFGLGRRGAEPVPADPVAWLTAQLEGFDPGLAVPGHSAAEGLMAIREQRRNKGDPNRGTPIRDVFRADAAQALDIVLTTGTPFRERLVWFWANHFTVSIRRGECAALTGAFVREAIRPHVTGHFGEMLLAVMRHPAMLLYLDNAQSIGPDSPAGERQHRGLNENLARESLELHTVSPAAGYTQADVTNYAKILTGWSLDMQRDPPGFLFRPFAHEPGPKMLMGHPFSAGEAGGIEALAWLAVHPATCRHLATKLARHFVADQPPAAVVDRLARVLQQSRGDLMAVSLELVRLPEAWRPLTKLRSPAEYVVAVLRALDLPEDKRPNVVGVMAGLGQPFFSAPLPNGWPDTAADWAGPEAILRRIDWAYSVSARAGALDPEEVAGQTLGPLLRADTLEQIRRAGSRREAFAMLFASPEFMRR